MEIWKDVKGYEGIYQISNYGKLKSLSRYTSQNHYVEEKLMKYWKDSNGYLVYSLHKNGKKKNIRAHQLVARTFVENPNNLNEIDHIDTNKENNYYKNLKFVTHSENHLNPLTVKLKKERMTGRKLSQSQIDKMRIKISVWKDDKKLYTFNSYKEMDLCSKDIFGVTLWNVYVRPIVNTNKTYHGYKYTIEK